MLVLTVSDFSEILIILAYFLLLLYLLQTIFNQAFLNLHHFDPGISISTIESFAIKFCTDVHGAKGMKCTHFVNHLIFNLAPLLG